MTFNPKEHCPFCGLSHANCRCTDEQKRNYWTAWKSQPDPGTPEERLEQDLGDEHDQGIINRMAGVQ